VGGNPQSAFLNQRAGQALAAANRYYLKNSSQAPAAIQASPAARATHRPKGVSFCGPASPVAGVKALLLGLISDNDETRVLGCMGVGAICEFGSTDPDIAALRSKVSPALHSRLAERLKEGQAAGEIDRSLNCATAASFIQMTMQSIQLAARSGIDARSLRAHARFAVERLKSR
jgi:hypothetical protein